MRSMYLYIFEIRAIGFIEVGLSGERKFLWQVFWRGAGFDQISERLMEDCISSIHILFLVHETTPVVD